MREWSLSRRCSGDEELLVFLGRLIDAGHDRVRTNNGDLGLLLLERPPDLFSYVVVGLVPLDPKRLEQTTSRFHVGVSGPLQKGDNNLVSRMILRQQKASRREDIPRVSIGTVVRPTA